MAPAPIMALPDYGLRICKYIWSYIHCQYANSKPLLTDNFLTNATLNIIVKAKTVI